MYIRQELEGKVLLAASTLGIDVCLDGSDLSGEDLYALKRELIEGFKVDPVVATFITVSLKNGVDFNWLNMYEDKRSLYQINLGLIQGIDMSFSKRYVYEPLQLEAIRQWAKRGVDMKDISFDTLPHKNIRQLAALKQNGCDYIQFVSTNYSPGYLRHFLEVSKMIGDLEQKEIFLRVENVINAKKLMQNGIDLKKLALVGFFEQSNEVHKRILSELGIALRRGQADRIKDLFEHIEDFSLQELQMVNSLFKLDKFEKFKAEKINRSTMIFKSFDINNVKGDPAIFDEFFDKDYSYYYEDKPMNCIKFGLDITPFLKDSVDGSVRYCIFNIANQMIDSGYGVLQIEDTFRLFEKAIDCLNDPKLVFKRLNNLTSSLSNFDYVDFNVLLDQSIPDDSKVEALLANHLKCDVEIIKNKNLSFFTQSRLLEKEIHEEVRELFLKEDRIDNIIDELNNAANSIDISKLNIKALSPPSIEILTRFNHLKNKPGFYKLAHFNFYGKVLFLGLDALELGLDILPVVKHFNGFYAKNMLRNMIEEHLNTTDYVSHSESEFKSSYEIDMTPF